MRRNRKVKILATLGPASSEEEMIQKLHEAGADLFRINMSHASHDVMRTLIKRIRAVEERCGRPIGILCDLQGPKLRVGKFAATKVTLKPGQTFTLDSNEALGDETRVYLPHPEILESVKAGDRLLIAEIDRCIGWCPTYLFNYTGHPAASIPAGFADGLPVGMQIVGRRYADVDVLAASAVFEQLRPWADTYRICAERRL